MEYSEKEIKEHHIQHKKNNALMMKMDKERRNSSGYKAQLSKSKALSKAKGGSLIERHNAMIAKRDAGKTKEQMSNDAFKSGRTSGRY